MKKNEAVKNRKNVATSKSDMIPSKSRVTSSRRPAWIDTVHDMDAYKLSEKEVEKRRELRSSSNEAAARWEEFCREGIIARENILTNNSYDKEFADRASILMEMSNIVLNKNYKFRCIPSVTMAKNSDLSFQQDGNTKCLPSGALIESSSSTGASCQSGQTSRQLIEGLSKPLETTKKDIGLPEKAESQSSHTNPVSSNFSHTMEELLGKNNEYIKQFKAEQERRKQLEADLAMERARITKLEEAVRQQEKIMNHILETLSNLAAIDETNSPVAASRSKGSRHTKHSSPKLQSYFSSPISDICPASIQ